MAKQTIQIADKPTLDEVKELLENSEYGLEKLKELTSQTLINVKKEKTVYAKPTYRMYKDTFVSNIGSNDWNKCLEIKGSGKLYAAAMRGTVGSGNYPIGLRILIDGVTIFQRKVYHNAGTTGSLYRSLGVFTKDFFPISSVTQSGRLSNFMMPQIYYNYFLNDEYDYTSGEEPPIVSNSNNEEMLAKLFDEPIEFTTGCEIYIYHYTSSGQINVVYSIDDD